MLQRVLEPEVMDTVEDANDYDTIHADAPEQAAEYEAQQQARTVAKLTKQAAALGYELRAVAGAA